MFPGVKHRGRGCKSDTLFYVAKIGCVKKLPEHKKAFIYIQLSKVGKNVNTH
jgi:hypothetical protein